VRQQRSVALAVAPLVQVSPDGTATKINLIDTPGYGDFVGELRAGLRAADAALFVVPASAGREGAIDPATVTQWEECAAVGMPRAVVVSRCDHPRADVEATIAACQDAFGAGVAPLYLPLRDGEEMTGLYGLITQTRRARRRRRGRRARHPARGDHRAVRGRDAHGALPRGRGDRHRGPDRRPGDRRRPRLVHPVLPVCAMSGVGLDALLDGMVRGFPSPLEHPLPRVSGVDGSPRPPLTADPDGPLAAEVVRTSADAYVGRVSLVRVFSGTLRPETSVHVSGHVPRPAVDGGEATDDSGHDVDERLAHVYVPLGAQLREVEACVAGDIAALTKLGSAETGDTVSAAADPLLLSCWNLPDPLLPVAVVAHSRADEDALGRTLTRLVAADPTLRLERNPETHQTVLWCMGEAHADVVLSRLRASGAEVDTEPVKVPLRATIRSPARVTGRHVKQSGGHGQYAVCHVEFEPLPRGSGFEFVSQVVGGSVPTQFIPSVEKGIRTPARAGLTDEHHPVVDVRATLVDGKAHSVDSSDAAFQTAGALALREAGQACGTVLLEPLDEVAVTIPDDHLGTVLGDLSGRRGRVLGTDVAGRDGRWCARRCRAPSCCATRSTCGR
jgi:elongation factor G